MNERIRELAEQAGMVRGGYANTPEKIMTWRESFDSPGSLNRFAELLIRECARVADIADENKCEWIGGNILTHFGVKE